MDDQQWLQFFRISIGLLGEGRHVAHLSPSWCSWTVFSRLESDCGYWTSGLPRLVDLKDTHIGDGGVWGQPFPYFDLAHIIIPRRFNWDKMEDRQYKNGVREQDIDTLSQRLTEAGIGHRKTDIILEIKLY